MNSRTIKTIGLIFALTMFGIALVTATPIARAKNSNAAPNVTANWVTTGNKIGNSDFLGTLNNKPLILKTNKVERMRLDTLGNVGIGTNAPTSKLTVAGVIQSTNGGFEFPDGTMQTTASVAGPNGWGLSGNGGTSAGTNFVGTTDNQALVFKTNNAERMRIDSSGKVGIGTTTPAHRLSIIGGPTWTSNSWTGALELGNGSAIGWQKNNNGLSYGIGQSNGGLYFFHTLSSPGTTTLHAAYDIKIQDDGKIGIGNLNPQYSFDILSTQVDKFAVRQVDGSKILTADGWGVTVEPYYQSGTSHVCYKDSYLSTCASAAEFVPTIDNGNGFPETADLVSIAPSAANPYGDAHGPFVVTKSAKACDDNLLGFIVQPESGADGVKKNDRYLPLAIYGYFPAKVTMENGAIHRGDALTSSSKAGYAMKATDACKIIGYALEDATADGQIQVFANHGENTAPVIAALKQENQQLKQALADLEARVAALEHASPSAKNAVAQKH